MGSRDHLFKVLVVGDAAVGKTSLVQRYSQDSFSKHYKSTVGVDFALKVLQWSDSEMVRLQLWDIAGNVGNPGSNKGRNYLTSQLSGVAEGEDDYGMAKLTFFVFS